MLPTYVEVITLLVIYGAIVALIIWAIRSKIKRDKKLLVNSEEDKEKASNDLSVFLQNNSNEQLEKAKNIGQTSAVSGVITKILLIILFIFSSIIQSGNSELGKKQILSSMETSQLFLQMFFNIFIAISLLLALLNPIVNLNKKFNLFLNGFYTKKTFKKLLKRSQICIIIYTVIFVPLSLGLFALFIIPNYRFLFKLKKLKYD